MTMITPSYLGETIEYSSLHACRSTLEDPTFQQAQIYDRSGKGADAVKIYQELSDKPNLFVPKPVVLLALADHYSTSDPAQAAKFYNQVKTQYPDTSAAQQADQRLQLLPSKT